MLLFIAGVFVGANVGYLAFAMCNASKSKLTSQAEFLGELHEEMHLQDKQFTSRNITNIRC
ncbi:hypothetical protein D9M69_657830 [compost metagenome]